MAGLPPSVWPLLGDRDVVRVLSFLARNWVAAPLGIAFELKMDEDKVQDILRKLEEAGLVKREMGAAQSQFSRAQYTLSAQGLKLRSQLLEMERGQRAA